MIITSSTKGGRETMDPGRPSFASSDTTYHSFNDIELLEPPSSPPTTSHGRPTHHHHHHQPSDVFNIDDAQYSPALVKMQRQDSGYASQATVSPRNSTSHSRPQQQQPSRRTSSLRSSLKSSINGAAAAAAAASSSCSSSVRPSIRSRVRPSTRRSTGSPPASNQVAYFQFPTPELVELTKTSQESSPATLPPQTTHYWTSDSTRRLEYAAIDAASRGVKGWIRRNLLPDCFVGKDRHVSFDDDSGSVRRYRLELEDDEQGDKFVSSPTACSASSSLPNGAAARSRRKSRFSFWTLRKNNTF